MPDKTTMPAPPPSRARRRPPESSAKNEKYLVLVILVCYTGAALTLVEPARLLFGGVSASGVVARMDYRTVPQPAGRPPKRGSTAVIRFEVDGRVREMRTASKLLTVGDAVTVRYMRDDFAFARLWSFWSVTGGALMFGFVGSCFLIIPVMGRIKRPAMTSIEAAAIARKSRAKRKLQDERDAWKIEKARNAKR